MKNLSYNELKMQSYLKLKNVSTAEKKILYKFRTRMINVNFNSGLKVSCPICSKENDTQEHLFTCEELIEESDIFDCQHIFSVNNSQIVKAAQLCRKVYRKREKMIKEKYKNNHVHTTITDCS